MNCHEALLLLTAAAYGQRNTDLTAADAHLKDCPACAYRFHRLIRAARSDDPDDLPCAEARAWLQAIVEGQVERPGSSSGPALSPERPEMRRAQLHLATCPACAAEARALQAVWQAANAGQLATPARTPAFDLSFLPRPSTELGPKPSRLWQEVQAGWRRLTVELPAAVLWGVERLVAPPPGLSLAYATTTARQRGRAGQETRPQQGRPQQEQVVTLTTQDPERDAQIKVIATRSDQGTTWLTVEPVILSSDQRREGARVALCDDTGQPLEVRTVHADALAQFTEVQPGRYRLRVEDRGQRWEIPLDLS